MFWQSVFDVESGPCLASPILRSRGHNLRFADKNYPMTEERFGRCLRREKKCRADVHREKSVREVESCKLESKKYRRDCVECKTRPCQETRAVSFVCGLAHFPGQKTLYFYFMMDRERIATARTGALLFCNQGGRAGEVGAKIAAGCSDKPSSWPKRASAGHRALCTERFRELFDLFEFGDRDLVLT